MTTKLKRKDIYAIIDNNKASLKEAKYAYLKTKAVHDTIKRIDLECKNAVLTRSNFKYADEWKAYENGEFVKDGKLDYLMSEADFLVYIQSVHIERGKKGIKTKDANTCPLHPSFVLMCEAKQHFINIALQGLPPDMQEDMKSVKDGTATMEHIDEFVELNLKLKVE